MPTRFCLKHRNLLLDNNFMYMLDQPAVQPRARAESECNEPGFLSVVVPCFNESEVIELFYRELRPVLDSLKDVVFEIIFVDDGSSDGTLDRLNQIAEGDPTVLIGG